MSGIFISYRRLDTKAEARALFERLRRDLPEERVFIDLEGIEIGVDFSKVIDDHLRQCHVALVLIGAHWLGGRDAAGRLRIEDENDFVRIETRAVLSRDIRVVPVLVGKASLPLSTDLPEDIRPLLRRHKFDLDLDTFDADMRELVAQIRRMSASPTQEPQPVPTAPKREPRKATPAAAPAEAPSTARATAESSAPKSASAPKGATAESPRKPPPAKEPSPAVPPKEPWWSTALGKIGTGIGVLAFLGYQVTWGPMKDWFGSSAKPTATGIEVKPTAPVAQATGPVASIPAPATPASQRSVAAIPMSTLGASVAIDKAVPAKPASSNPLPDASQVTRPIATPVKPFTRFRDCESDECPWMISLPAGSFMMGSPETEPDRDKDEGPLHRVQVKPIAVGQYEVTFAQWDACVAGRGCSHKPADQGWGRSQRPVIYVSWNDAQDYVAWLSRKTGQAYRLLSEAEWEYAARAGTTTPFAFGRRINTNEANFDGNNIYNGGTSGVNRSHTLPVGSLAANGWGLYDMHGNVAEWVQDCWHGNYSGAPVDGSSWTVGCTHDRRMVRGGGWNNSPRGTRSAIRNDSMQDIRNGSTGFRIARALLGP